MASILQYCVWIMVLLQISAAQTFAYAPLDGAGNNKQHPSWGVAGTPFLWKQVPQATVNSTQELAGANRPSARAISLALTNSPYFKASSRYNTSYLLSALGQVIVKDVSYAWTDKVPTPDQAPIAIPPGDPMFYAFSQQRAVMQNSRKVLEFNRTNFVRSNTTGQRQPINTASSFVDASMLYGQDGTVSKRLRVGTAGRMREDDDRVLPYNYNPSTGDIVLNMSNLAARVPDTDMRMSGHPHINQNPFPLVMTTLLLREHNRRAQQIENQHPDWGDEQIFQEARKWVIAHCQRITFVDYMNELGIPLNPYTGYNASVNPSIDAFFSTVAFRYGHATLTDVVLRLDDDWREHPKGHLPLMQTYYNPGVVLSAGVEPVIRGLIALPQGEIESRWSSSVAGNLWGYSTVNGTDLVALNIQRGRDHGIPDYNSCRRALGLKPIRTFTDLTPDPQLAFTLQDMYQDVNNIDAYIGGLAEPHFQEAHMGELFYLSMLEQFTRLRDGDVWYFENTANGLFSKTEVEEIQKTSLRDLILRNTNITNLPDNIFSAAAVAGSCSAAGSGSGSASQQSLLLPNLLGGAVQLQVKRAATDGWVNVKVTSAGDGWLGFGVAAPGAAFAMIGADMVIARMVDGTPQVHRFTAKAHAPPVQAPDSNQLKLVRFEQANGQSTLEFERPLAASANAQADGSIAISLESPVTLLVAGGPGSDVTSMAAYHGPQNRDYKTVNQLFSGAPVLTDSAGTTAARDSIAKRKAHGILMALNFIVVLPLGALAARQLRCHWLKSTGLRASLFYVHVITQVCGVVIGTTGFVLATHFFGTNFRQVAWHHGKLGVAILVLIYSQLLMGFVRPAAAASSNRRRIWDYAHTLLGRAAMMLGVMNVIIGIFIFTTIYQGDLALWGGLCAAALAAIHLLQYTLDRHEKCAVLALERDMLQEQLNNNRAEQDDEDSPTALGGYPAGVMRKDTLSDAVAALPPDHGLAHKAGFMDRIAESAHRRHEEQAFTNTDV